MAFPLLIRLQYTSKDRYEMSTPRYELVEDIGVEMNK